MLLVAIQMLLVAIQMLLVAHNARRVLSRLKADNVVIAKSSGVMS